MINIIQISPIRELYSI